MKKKIILDLFFYMGVPLLVWNFGRPYMGDYYAILFGTIPALIFTIVEFFQSKEFNVSGLFLMGLMILNFVLNIISKSALEELWNGVYMSIIVIIFYAGSMVFKKPIGMYFFVDYAYAKGIPRKTSLERYTKKEYLVYFQWFTIFLASREVIVIIVKSFLINNFGLNAFNTIQIVMQVISYVFMGITVLLIVKILNMIKKMHPVTPAIPE